jgi:hypothetical protein
MTTKKKIFKNFLLSKKSNFTSHAISKLHVTYDSYKKNENFYPILSLIKKIFYFFDNKTSFIKNKKRIDILIISNCVSTVNKNDIYFGNLKYLLKKKKINTLSVFRNLTPLKSKFLKKFNKKHLLLSKRLEYHKEFLILCFFLKETFLFIFSRKYFSLKKYLSIKDLFSIIPNLRLIFQLEELLKFYKPKFIMFTYEGHAWERLLVYLCNKSQFRIKSIAYQFSMIKKSQEGFFNKLKEKYNPDFIATTGKIPHKIIKNRIKFSKIIKLGSPKYCKKVEKNLKNNNILVALDTDEHSLFKIVNFCKLFAINNIKYKIILRLHPILNNNKKLIQDINKIIINVPNIKLSKSSLNNDLKRTKYLLYTESTICLTALKFNIVPLFLNFNNVKNIFDRYFPKKNIINTFNDLKSFLEDKKNKKLSQYFKNYRDNYFEKYEIKFLEKILKH